MNLLNFMRDVIYEEKKECITNYDVEKIFSHQGYLYTNRKSGKIDDVFEEILKNNDFKKAKGIILSISVKNKTFDEKIYKLLDKFLDEVEDEYSDFLLYKLSSDDSLKDDEIILDYILTGLEVIS